MGSDVIIVSKIKENKEKWGGWWRRGSMVTGPEIVKLRKVLSTQCIKQ